MYSIADLSGSAGQSNFAFSFPYLSQDHIFVYIDEVETTDFTFNSAFVIHLTTPLAAAATVRIQRITPLDEALVNYNNGSTLGESDLDTATLQLLYIVQEQQDTVSSNDGEYLRRPDSDTGVLADMPDEATRANSLLYFDANGDPTVVAHITSGTLSFTPLTQFLSGNGSQTVFALSSPPGSHSALILAISGVVQKPGVDFTVSDTTLTFTTAPAVGANNICVQNFGVAREVNTVPVSGIVGQLPATQVDYTPAMTGGILRTQDAKNYDMWSVKDFQLVGDGVTSDQTRMATAVASAYAAGRDLYWPTGTYVSTATIPNFHNVRHFGPGIVKRGSDLFYVEPTRTQSNQTYVATTGNNANDGLSATEPTLTVQQAVDNLKPYAPLAGPWTIWLGAGTYTESASLPSNTSFNDSYLTIRGPVPPTGSAISATTNSAGYGLNATVITLASAGTGSLIVGDTITFAGDANYYRITVGDTNVANGGTITITPGLLVSIGAAPVAITRQTTNHQIPTAFIDYPGSGTVGLDINQSNKVKIQDIKFTDWMGSATTGINADQNSVLWTYNAHASYCRQGIVGNFCQAYIQGGILHGVDWSTGAFPAGGGSVGVVMYAGALCSLGYGGTNYLTGTIIENMAQAGYEGKARTHVVSSWVTFQSNEVAVWLYTDSRFDDRHNIYRKNELIFKNQNGFISRDSVLGLSEYNVGITYAQAPDTAGIGNFEHFNMFQYAVEEVFMHPDAIGGLDICKQHVSSTLQTGTIAATLTRLLATIPANNLNSGSSTNGKYLEVFLCGVTAGATNTKTITLRLGGTVLTTLTIATGSITWTAHVTIWANNATSVTQITEAFNATITTVRSNPATVDVTLDNALEVWTAIPGAADTAQLHEARVIKWG